MSLPIIPFALFFGLMVALQIIDAWSTYTGMKLGAVEANGFLKKLMKEVGTKDALFIVKSGYLAWLWFYPPTDAVSQWMALGLYIGVAINNLRIVRKLKKE